MTNKPIYEGAGALKKKLFKYFNHKLYDIMYVTTPIQIDFSLWSVVNSGRSISHNTVSVTADMQHHMN